MSLTSYRAAPPRVNVFGKSASIQAKLARRAGTYSRFEADVKRAVDPYMGIRLKDFQRSGAIAARPPNPLPVAANRASAGYEVREFYSFRQAPARTASAARRTSRAR